MRVVLALLCLVLPCLADAADRQAQQYAANRLKLREQRNALAAIYQEAKQNAYTSYAKGLQRALQEAVQQGRPARGQEILQLLQALDGTQYADLAQAVALAQPCAPDQEAKADAAIDTALTTARESRSTALIGFTNKLNQAGLYHLAWDNVQEILREDPDNRPVRKFLGQGFDRDTGQWQHGYYLQYAKDGLKWDDTRGWWLPKFAQRYEAGEHYDVAARTWGKLEDLNAAHQSLDNPWEINTQHFEVRAGTDLATAVECAVQLEQLYRVWVRSYVAFFGKEAPIRLFDLKPTPKLRVYLWANEAMWNAWCDRTFPRSPIAKQSIGMYSTNTKASHFYVRPDWQTTLWHEVTHQIFGECSPGHARQPTLAEGLAVYTQNGKIINDAIVLDLADNRHIRGAAPLLLAGKVGSFWDTWDLGYEQFHGAERGLNYARAGLVVFFLMQYQDGLYAADLIDYTTEAYAQGEPKIPLEYWLGGVDRAELDRQFQTWVNEQLPKVRS